MRIFGDLRRAHALWFLAMLGAGALAWAYARTQVYDGRPPGGSVQGLVLGSVAAAIIVFEIALWPRKKYRAARRLSLRRRKDEARTQSSEERPPSRGWRPPLGRARTWMIAHIWLGFLVVPVTILHAGWGRFGGWLSASLFWILVLVVASGAYGLLLQNLLTTKLSKEVPSETVATQIDAVIALLVQRAELLVQSVCVPGASSATAVDAVPAARGRSSVGAERKEARVFTVARPRRDQPGTEQLWVAYEEEIRPYLQDGALSGARITDKTGREAYFGELRQRLRDAAEAAEEGRRNRILEPWEWDDEQGEERNFRDTTVTALEACCAERASLDHQRRLQRRLHGWLAVHLPLAIALGALLVLHIVYALMYR